MSTRLYGWVNQSAVTAERNTKHSAAVKMKIMMNNALDMVRIRDDDDQNLIPTYYGAALQTFAKNGKKFRDAGGFLWAWQRVLKAKTYASDGVWIPARLVASNIAQYIVSIYLLIAGLRLVNQIDEDFNKQKVQTQLEEITSQLFDLSVNNDLVQEVVANTSGIVGSFLSNNQDIISADCSNSLSAAELLVQCSTTTCATTDYLCPLLEQSSVDLAEQTELLSRSGFDVDLLALASNETLRQATRDSVASLYPSSEYMIVIPIVVAVIAAFLTSFYLAVTYIPSVTNTVMKLRCGNIPTLRDPNFRQYRVAPDQVAILTGSLFWGALYSSLVVGGLLGLVIAFFVWQVTAFYAQRFTALVSGVILITLIRLCSLLVTRKLFFRSFYREKPGPANIQMLILEWANVSLTAGYIFVRMMKLIFVAAACIGRIDTPLLAPGVGRIAGIELDHYHMVHVKDILSHEAHRHPFIETLGVIYMMKLRYRYHFGRRANSIWRLIFVYALMPWLQKYRILTRVLAGGDDGGDAEEDRNPVLDRLTQVLCCNKNEPGKRDDVEEGGDHSTLRPSKFLNLHQSRHKLVGEDGDIDKAQQRLASTMRRAMSQMGIERPHSKGAFLETTPEEESEVEQLREKVRSLELELQNLRASSAATLPVSNPRQ